MAMIGGGSSNRQEEDVSSPPGTQRQGFLCPISPRILNSNGDLLQNSDIGVTGGTEGGNAGQISSNSPLCLFHLPIDKYQMKSVGLGNQLILLQNSDIRATAWYTEGQISLDAASADNFHKKL